MVTGFPSVAQCDVWWADLGEPRSGEAGFHRPVVVVQSDSLNVSRHRTVICVPLTSNTAWRSLPWNLLLPASSTGLEKDSLAQATLVLAVDKDRLFDRVGRISEPQLRKLFQCLDLTLGR